MFITFEGIEGSGKTTQIIRLKEHFESQGQKVVVTKEPGGTEIGFKIREILLDPNLSFSDSRSELLLFFADRIEHLSQVIEPALSDNKIVICDRYLDSTYAYQVGGRQLKSSLIDSLATLITRHPDRTFLLDLDPSTGLTRAKNRAELDRFETEELDFHQRIREHYLGRAKKEPNRFRLIDANQSIDAINQSIKDTL